MLRGRKGLSFSDRTKYLLTHLENVHNIETLFLLHTKQANGTLFFQLFNSSNNNDLLFISLIYQTPIILCMFCDVEYTFCVFTQSFYRLCNTFFILLFVDLVFKYCTARLKQITTKLGASQPYLFYYENITSGSGTKQQFTVEQTKYLIIGHAKSFHVRLLGLILYAVSWLYTPDTYFILCV